MTAALLLDATMNDTSETPAATDAATTPATETPPDRLSNNPASPHYDEVLLARGIGIRFKGVERTNVDEYCVSEGWVRLSVAGSKDRYGIRSRSSSRAR